MQSATPKQDLRGKPCGVGQTKERDGCVPNKKPDPKNPNGQQPQQSMPQVPQQPNAAVPTMQISHPHPPEGPGSGVNKHPQTGKLHFDPSKVKETNKPSEQDVLTGGAKKEKAILESYLVDKSELTKASCCLYEPDLDSPNDRTGVPDKARVGVPAMSVPPPPDEIPRLPNLTKKQRKVETRFAEAYLKNPDKMAQKYLKALKKRKVGEYPNIFATDDVKMLNPDWNPGEARLGEELPDESKKAMAKYNTAVHQTANAVAKRAFLMYLDETVSKLPKDKRVVLVTNGGCAAGKGSSLKRAGEGTENAMLPAADMVGAVWDAAGEQNATENAWVYEECKKRGIKTVVSYVWADPKDTWDSGDRGVIRRAMRKGRMVGCRLFADSYAKGARNMKAFADKYGGKSGLEFIYVDNRNKAQPKQLNSFPEETLKWNSDDIYKMAVDGLLKRKDDLLPSLVKGGLADATIWGPPK